MARPKRQKQNDKSDKEPAHKKTCIRSSEDPNITIVVGGKEFQEYSHSLRCWSDYFDRALSSGMKESDTHRFEFQDKDPQEWEWIVSLMAPLSSEKVTVEKLSVALDWFDLLCCKAGLEICDKIMCADVLSEFKYYGELAMKLVMDNLETTIKYNLKASKDACFKSVKEALTKNPILFTNSDLELIVSLMIEHAECRSEFMGPLKSNLPSSISEDQVQVLFDNGMLLAAVVNLEIDKKRVAERMIAKVDGSWTAKYELRGSIARDEALRPVLPAWWRRNNE